MTIPHRLIAVLTIIMMAVCHSGCSILIGGAIVKKKGIREITVKNGAIPPEFGATDSTLVCIIRNRSGYDKYMKKHVTNEFHGKYVFATEAELTTEKYKDLTKYQYVFDGNKTKEDMGVMSHSGPGGSTYENTAEVIIESYYIYDRKNDIHYQSPITSSFFAKLIQAYMINLEKERIKAGGK